MSSRFPSLCLAAFLMVGAFVSSSFGQSPGKNPAAGNDPERPVQYISLQQAYEMAVKNETVSQQNQITGEQLRILKPLPTGFVSAGGVFVCVYPDDQTDARISALIEKAAVARKAGKVEVARAYYESISSLCPQSKYVKEATRFLEEMKERLPGTTNEPNSANRELGKQTEDIRQFKDDPHPELLIGYRFWWLTIRENNLRYERISGSTGP